MLSRLSRNTGTWIEMNKGGLSMKAISRWLDRFCYKHPRFGIPNLMKYIVIGNVLVYFLDMFSHGYVSYLLAFYPSRILHGEVWRLLTFLFIPVSGYSSGDMFSILWFAMSTLFYYYIGNALERQWGSTRFTVFYALGAILNMIIGFAFQSGVTMYYVNMSMFFSFATLYPDMQVMLYGILPLKVKWLAWLDAALFAYDIVSGARRDGWPIRPGPRPSTSKKPRRKCSSARATCISALCAALPTPTTRIWSSGTAPSATATTATA